MARFLQHVLPTDFAKIRYSGVLSPSCCHDLQRARELLESAAATEPTQRLCPVCKRGNLSFRGIILRARPPP